LSNKECISNLENKLQLELKSQILELDSAINAIKTSNAAKGALQSSATIKMVLSTCKDTMERRSTIVFDGIKSLPFEYSRDLYKKLVALSEKYFDEDVEEFKERVRKIATMANGERFIDRYLHNLFESNRDALDKLKNNLETHCIQLKNQGLSKLDKVLLVIEGICLLATAFLAGQWSMNPKGNFEPYIVIIGVLVPLIELSRRIYKKTFA
jgi:hypothetical protein